MLRALTIDFNSFFASVEQQERPELRGKPLGIVPVMAETTGCIAVSLEAKQLGLTRNARVSDARRQCPGIIFVEARPETYIAYHRRLVDVIERCLHVDKVQSIDEVTCFLKGRFAERDRALAVAREIKATIAREVGPLLRSSIGIAPNWLLAKVASDMQKPDGLVVLDEPDLPGKLLHLQPGDISGIGPNMQERLRARGITTIAQLYAATEAELRGIWQSVRGAQMWQLLHGHDLPFFTEVGGQTIGHGHVLPPDKRNPVAALAVLHRLLQKAAMRLRADRLYAGSLSLSVRYPDDSRWGDELNFNDTQDTFALTHALNTLWARRPAKLRHRGPLKVDVHLSRLISAEAHTPDLFEAPQEKRREKLHAAIDDLNKVFGKGSVYLGGAHGATGNAPMRIAFTRIPVPELEEIDRSRARRVRPVKKSTPPPPDAE